MEYSSQTTVHLRVVYAKDSQLQLRFAQRQLKHRLRRENQRVLTFTLSVIPMLRKAIVYEISTSMIL